MLVPSHLEDDVAGLIFNAESLPVYTAPSQASSPRMVSSTVDQPVSDPPYESPNGRTGHLDGLPAYQPPSPVVLRSNSVRSQQADNLPAYRLPSSFISRNSSPRSQQTDTLPAYRPWSPVVSRSASVRSQQADDLPAYRAQSPVLPPTTTHSPAETTVIPPPPPLFATPAQPVTSAIATQQTHSDSRPVNSILRVRNPIPGTTYPFDPNAADRTAEDGAFALALFTEHNSRPPSSAQGHATYDELLTEEEIFGFDVDAYNARQAWRERRAEERRLRYVERQRYRQSQARGEEEEDVEEMYQLQEAIQMSLEEAETDGAWGWAAEGGEDEDLAEAIRRSTMESQGGRDCGHHGCPVHHPIAYPVGTHLQPPPPHMYEYPRSTNVIPAQMRSTRFDTLRMSDGLSRYPSLVGLPSVTQARGGATDTNKPLPGLPPAGFN